MSAPITTHILNLQSGSPAAGVDVELTSSIGDTYIARTNKDGRITDWNKNIVLNTGSWTLTFAVEKWFEDRKEKTFYSDVVICFKVEDTTEHYHVPLLINAFGYSTYRGS